MIRSLFIASLLTFGLVSASAQATPDDQAIQALMQYDPHEHMAEHGATLPDGSHVDGETARELIESGEYMFQMSIGDAPDAVPNIRLIEIDDDMRAFMQQAQAQSDAEGRSDQQQATAQRPSPENAVGQAWPFPRFTTLDGKDYNLQAADAPEVTIIDYWFTLCRPCIDAMPQLNALQAEYADQPVAFIAPTFEADQPVERFLNRHEFNFDIVTNANDWFIDIIGSLRAPVYLWINSDNTVEAVLEGPEELQQRLQEHFATS